MRKFVSIIIVAMFVLGISEICYGFGIGEFLSEKINIRAILGNTSLNTTQQDAVAANLMSVLEIATTGVEVATIDDDAILMDNALYEAITGDAGIGGIRTAVTAADADQLTGVAGQLGIPAQLVHEDLEGTRDMILGVLGQVQEAAQQALTADEEAL